MKTLIVLLSIFAAACPRLSAETFVVTTTSDAGSGSLRQAITSANGAPEDSSIALSATGTILLSSPLPTLVGNTSIMGPGAELLRISGGNACRVFSMAAGTTNKLSGFTVADGFADTNSNGAAISNAGVLMVENCVITNNHSVGGLGGAIYTVGELKVLNTIVISNSVMSLPPSRYDGKHSAFGGAIYATNCPLYLTNTAFVGNQALASNSVVYLSQGGSLSEYSLPGNAAGGAVLSLGGTVYGENVSMIGNCAFGGNGSATYNLNIPGGWARGGAIYAEVESVSLQKSHLSENKASSGNGGNPLPGLAWPSKGGFAEGGAIWAYRCDVLLSGTTLVKNAARSGAPAKDSYAAGGAMYIADSVASFLGLTVVSNSADGGATAEINFFPTGGDAFGGGLYCTNSTLDIVSLAAACNQARAGRRLVARSFPVEDGGVACGGFLFGTRSTVRLVTACVSQNVASGGKGETLGGNEQALGGNAFGAGIFVDDSTITNTSCTIASNIVVGGLPGNPYNAIVTNGPATGIGGGIYSTNATVAFLNTILADNTASYEGDDFSGTTISLGHNLVGTTAGASGWLPSDLLNVDPLLAPLRLNGGHTLNHALLCGSPAIDTGDDSTSEATDQRGVPRPQGTHVDIGSFEFVNSGPPPTVMVFPQTQKLFAGTNTTLIALPQGYGGFHYQWRRDGEHLAGATGRTLSLTNLNRTHSGAYSVVVADCFGVVTSGVSMVRVQYVNAYAEGRLLYEDRYHFDGPVTIDLQSYFPGGLIFYTLNGSTPGIDSQIYTGPFDLHQNAVLRAVGYSSNFFDSGESEPVQVELAAVYTFQASTPGGGYVEWTPRQDRYISGTPVTISAIASNGWTFLGWLGDIGQASNISAITLNVSRDRCVQAIFGTTLETSAAGNGALKLQPSGDYFPYGSVVRIYAVPGSNSYFGFWGGSASGTNNPNSFLMTSPEPRVSSIFGSLGSNQVSLSVVPKGFGHASVIPYSTRYVRGTVVTVTAQPDADQVFIGWEGDGSGAINPFNVTLDRTKTITPVFTRRPKLSAGGCLDGWSSGGFWSTVTGEMRSLYRIDVSTNLQHWSTVATISNSFGRVSFSDPSVTNSPHRFYRAVEQP